MRKRTAISNNESDEESIPTADPEENNNLVHKNDDVDCTHATRFLQHMKEGKLWWTQCTTISIAAVLSYSYNNVGDHSTNVQIAIMTTITLFGASPLVSTHLGTAAIGAFVGGQNIIGSVGLIDNTNIIEGTNFLWLLVFSNVVGVVWVFVMQKWRILDGYAGRLGTTTFIGMNIVMLTLYGPCGVVAWDRYWYGLVQVLHVGEEDSRKLPLSSAWEWWEEAELAIGYVLAVLWLGVVGGGTRILHNNYLQNFERNKKEASKRQPPPPLNNILIPVLWALFSMLTMNATQYEHSPGIFNGFAVGSYVAMASLQKISTIGKFAVVSLISAVWGLTLTPFVVGFAGKSGFTAMLGHLAVDMIEKALGKLRTYWERQEQQKRQLEMQQREEEEQCRVLATPMKDAVESSEEEDEEPPSPHRVHKPRTEQSILTKHQRRQKKKLKHMQQQNNPHHTEPSFEDPPKLHHRAWSALPKEADGTWQHSLESQQELNSIV
jgi:hypothetical protein